MLESKTNLNDDTIKDVQKLIEINIDSSRGFRKAADEIESAEVADYFRSCAERRAVFADELQQHVALSGDEPEDSGSAAGTLHRWWLDLRGKIADGEEGSILAEAERGEEAIKHRYEKVLKETAGSALNSTLNQQYASVKTDHDAIVAMKEARS